MASLLERKLVVVTGKGGTGKTTVAGALGLLAARRGLRTVVVEAGGQQRLAELFERGAHGGSAARAGTEQAASAASDAGEPQPLQDNLWVVTLDPDRALHDWLAASAGRIAARVLSGSSTFNYFAAAAPGATELVTLVAVLRLCEGPYDLVVLDAPATGHALAMLRSPQTFTAIVRGGPMASAASDVAALLKDPKRCAYAAVAQGSEMAVTETLELEEQLRRLLDRDLDAVFVNGALPRRFSKQDMQRIATLPADPATAAAIRTAQTLDTRARTQQAQIARLRRQRFAEGAPPGVYTIPYQFVPELDLDALNDIAQRLARAV